MVDVASPSASSDAPGGPRSRAEEKRPLWLLAIYLLFLLVCLNAARTYRDQKRLVRLQIEERTRSDGEELHYSAGAEEHVVSSNYGSSMYGGSIHAAASPGVKKRKPVRPVNFDNVRPKPSDGTKDYNTELQREDGKHPPSDFGGFSFYAMADTPYTEWQEKRLRSQMAELRDYQKNNPKRNITLGIHLGNTQKVSNSLCADAAYENHAYLLSKGPRPTFVTPGNNDWFDCPRREEAFGLFMKHLGPDFVSKWHAEHYENLGVERSGDNPELFRLYVEGILFIGVHMIDGPANQESEPSFNKRMKTSMEWFAQSVETSFAEREIRGVIVMGNAGRSERTQPFFAHMNKYFVGIGSRENVPVIYLHGNGLAYKFDRSFSRQSGWDAFYDIQIDRGALTEPCIIDVAPRKNGTVQELETGRDESMIQSVIEDGLFRLDQQRGRYPDPMDIPT